jgi:predicted ATPase
MHVYHLTRSEHEQALQYAKQMEELAEGHNETALSLLAYSQHGLSRFFLGEFDAARNFYEKCYGLGSPTHRAVYATLPLAQDPHVVTLTWLALTLAYLGYVDQARSCLNVALPEARRLEHDHTLAQVLSNACWVEWITSSLDQAQCYADEAIALSDEHGFPFFLGWGSLYRGWSLTAVGRVEEGLTSLKQGLSIVRETGAVVGTSYALTMIIEACVKLGRLAEGLGCLGEAVRFVEQTNERYNEAELYRLRGDFLSAGDDRLAAEQNYRQALVVAKRQSAKIFELRSATSLARLWCDQGKLIEARELLEPIHSWFPKDIETRDLKAAKSLLDRLAREGRSP